MKCLQLKCILTVVRCNCGVGRGKAEGVRLFQGTGQGWVGAEGGNETPMLIDLKMKKHLFSVCLL